MIIRQCQIRYKIQFMEHMKFRTITGLIVKVTTLKVLIKLQMEYGPHALNVPVGVTYSAKLLKTKRIRTPVEGSIWSLLV